MVDEPSALVIDSVIAEPQQLAGENDGRITIYAKGGTPLLVYQINSLLPQYSNVFTNLAPGKYKPFVNDANGCGPIESDSVVIDRLTYLSTPHATGFEVMPNPATTNIVVRSLERPLSQIEIFNAAGKRVYSQKLSRGEREVTIEVAQFAKGLYLVAADKLGQQRVVIK